MVKRKKTRAEIPQLFSPRRTPRSILKILKMTRSGERREVRRREEKNKRFTEWFWRLVGIERPDQENTNFKKTGMREHESKGVLSTKKGNSSRLFARNGRRTCKLCQDKGRVSAIV